MAIKQVSRQMCKVYQYLQLSGDWRTVSMISDVTELHPRTIRTIIKRFVEGGIVESSAVFAGFRHRLVADPNPEGAALRERILTAIKTFRMNNDE